MKHLIFVLTIFLISMTTQAGTAPHFKKVFLVIFENTNYQEAIQAPFISQLIKEGALFNNFNGEVHPSQGNYIALTAGDFFNVTSDNNVTLNVSHIGDLLEAKGLQWKVYAEDYPGNCFLGNRGSYARKHVPFISFKNVQLNPSRCQNIVNAKEFTNDFNANKLPDYMMYVPNLKNDGHDTGVKFADQWLQKSFGPLMKDPRFNQDLLFVLTFDESQSHAMNHTLTVLWGPSILSGSVVSTPTNHYTLLKMIEDNFSLGHLGRNDASAPAIESIWR